MPDQNQAEQEFTLNRDNQRPIKFIGTRIAEESDRFDTNPNGANRWHEVSLYRTKAGKFVLSLEYVTQWQGENGSTTVLVEDEESSLVERLADEFKGFPKFILRLLRDAGIDTVEVIA